MSYQAYPIFKQTGIVWLEQVPAHWNFIRFGYCTHIREGQVDPDEYPYRDMLLIAPNHIESNTAKITDVTSASDQNAISGKYLVYKGDVVYSKIRPHLNKCSISNFDGLCSADMYSIAVEHGLTAKFLVYWMLAQPFLDYATESSMRVAMPKLNRDTLNAGPLALPPVDEQDTITSFLDRKTERIDALIEKKQTLIKKLQEKRIASISHGVTRGLGPTVSMQNSNIDWLGHVPRHWEIKRLKFIAKVGNGSTPNRDNTDYWEEGDYPWLNSSVVNQEAVTRAEEFVTATALAECHLPKVHPPAVLVGITGEGRTRGMATTLLMEATINQHLAFVKPEPTKAVVPYLRRVFDMAYAYLRSESDGGGSTKGAITCEQISEMPIPVPPLPEQVAIANYVDAETARIDRMIAMTQAAIAHLNEYRTALITAATTGKIDVRQVKPGSAV